MQRASATVSDPRVLLVCMPMGLVQTPNLGLSLLKASCTRSGFSCDVRYLSVEFLEQFISGSDAIPRYVQLVDQPHLSEVCASYFARLRFGPDPERDALVASHLRSVTPAERDLIADIERSVEPFLDYCLEAVPWEKYSVVGFTTLFAGMTVPAAVLASRLKARYSHLTTVLGGWNTGDEMGVVIAERLREFDYILRGESENTFPDLVRRVIAGVAVDGVPGIVHRDASSSRARSVPQQLVRDMDGLPFPDFTDYFATVDQGRLRGDPPGGWSIPFESSRGCWWGQVRHCKFCGLNGLSMPYRSKSPQRLIDEVDAIVARYHPRLLFAADTILDANYYESVLPVLAARYPGVDVAYEVKAPVKRKEMARLAKASVTRLTIGVESLSTRILRLMQKGTTYLKNVHCLRLAAEFGIDVGWQYLYGFPGEQLDDYRERLKDLPLLHHLPPPLQACPVTLARFSPYFFDAASNGVTAVRAHRDYRMTFAWPQEDLDRVAYHFEFDFDQQRPADLTPAISAMMTTAVEQWRRAVPAARLEFHQGRAVGWIVDTRFDGARVYELGALGCRALQALDTDTTIDAACDALSAAVCENALDDIIGIPHREDVSLIRAAKLEAGRLGTVVTRIPSPFDDAVPGGREHVRSGVVSLLESFRALGLVVNEHDRWLSLAVPAQLATTGQHGTA
jgi:ribosomal peptide maturation radical SAM protein 1